MRDDLRRTLDRSPAFQALSPDEQRALAEDLQSVADYLDDPATEKAAEGSEAARDLLGDVNFPAFVAGLIDGVFQAIVDASIEQMKAYADMLQAVAKSLGEFTQEESTAQDGGPRPERQQQLAAMVLLGIHRIVVTSGKIKPQVQFDHRATSARP